MSWQMCGCFTAATARASRVDGKLKKTGQICRREKSSVSGLELASLAGFFAFIWSNLCTRHIPVNLAPRGHHDWPDKRATLRCDGGDRLSFSISDLATNRQSSRVGNDLLPTSLPSSRCSPGWQGSSPAELHLMHAWNMEAGADRPCELDGGDLNLTSMES
jgi:hypothetical protein